jgi:hypothetical protein
MCSEFLRVSAVTVNLLTVSWPAGHISPTYKESFQVCWDNSIPLFLHAAIYLEVSRPVMGLLYLYLTFFDRRSWLRTSPPLKHPLPPFLT